MAQPRWLKISGVTALVLLFVVLTTTLLAADRPAGPQPVLPEHFQWFGPPNHPLLEAAWVIGSEKGTGPYALRVRLKQGGRIPLHTHPDERHSVVLSGTLYVGFGQAEDDGALVAVPTGAVYTAPANVPHFLVAKDGDVVCQENGVGPTATDWSEH